MHIVHALVVVHVVVVVKVVAVIVVVVVIVASTIVVVDNYNSRSTSVHVVHHRHFHSHH